MLSPSCRIRQTVISCLLLLTTFSLASSTARGPVSYISLVQDAIIHTPGQRINHLSTFDITFALHRRRQQIKLSLEPNHDIVDDATIIETVDADGNIVKRELLDRSTVKVFRGTSWVGVEGDWVHAGWARVYVHHDGSQGEPLFDGAFALNGDNHHIQTRTNYMSTRHELDPTMDGTEEFMVITRDSDVNVMNVQRRDELGVMCNSDVLKFNIDPSHPIHQHFSGNSSVGVEEPPAGVWGSWVKDSVFTGAITKRQVDGGGAGAGGFSGGVNLRDTIGSTAGCPSTKKVALFGIVADCTYVQTFNGDNGATRSNIITQINSASELYERSFNISLGLSNLIVSDSACPVTPPATTPWNNACSANITIEDRLNLLSAWRGTRSDDGLAFWTQLTNCPTGASVGLAWLGMLCQPQAVAQGGAQGTSSVSSANVVAKTSTEWKVIAHEVGHTFGAVHDCTADTCADAQVVSSSQCCPLSASTCNANAQYIMNPSTDEQISAFSPCTIGNICSALGKGSVNSTCLTSNRNITTITENRCGNGIVETGEECDCGGTDGCKDNTCCDPTTCRFINNAVCDDSNEDCCSQCQFASNSTVCRPSTSSCDPSEMCPGTVALCPDDVVSPNGQDCGGGLKCASGQCTSRDLQCRTVMGTVAGTGNDTHSCDDTNCQLTCASPQFGSGVCYGLSQWYLDGSPCGSGGSCKSGACQGANIFNDVRSWIDRHKTLVIILASSIGGFFVLLFIFCCFRSCRRRSKIRKLPPPGPQYITPGYGGYTRSAPMTQSGGYYPPPPANFRGNRGMPMSNYGGMPPMYQEQEQRGPSRSVRYA